MNEKRYAIIRVDNKCPLNTEDNYRCTEDIRRDSCKKCKEIYGETKMQLVGKIAQVLFKEELGWYAEYVDIIPKGKIDEPFWRNIYEHCLEKARKIVEFLGVVE